MFPQDGDEPLKSADTAMYQAKNQGKNSFHFFTQDLDRKLKEKLVLENQLRKALEKEEFVLYYQPQIDITTGKMIGVEALVRWDASRNGDGTTDGVYSFSGRNRFNYSYW